jgi:tRNA (guanine10-N2)-dimethyltransferase
MGPSVKLLIEPSLECESLARSEVLAAIRALGSVCTVVHEGPGVLVVETGADAPSLASRLGLCHFVSEWLGSCDPERVEECASHIDVKGPVRVRTTRLGSSSIGADAMSITRSVGGILGRDGGVDLRSPESDVRVVLSEKVHIGRLVGSVDRASFEKRKTRYLPYDQPVSLHPKLARALVNLASVPRGGRMLDPFCGTGGVVAEAAMVGIDALGSDISAQMVEGAERNLRSLGLTADMVRCDVAEIPSVFGGVDGIATDPPYGRSSSTNGEEIARLYQRSLRAFSEVLSPGSRAALVVPDSGLLEPMTDFVLEEKHVMRVHRSLTRHFCVLRRV